MGDWESRPQVTFAPPTSNRYLPVHPLEHYLSHLAAIRNTGAATPETSFYPPLVELLNAIGHTLKPKVRALNQLEQLARGELLFLRTQTLT